MKKQQTAPYIVTFILFITMVIGCYTNRDVIIPATTVTKTETKAEPVAGFNPLVMSDSFTDSY